MSLSYGVIVEVLLFLHDVNDIVECSAACREFHQVACSNAVWVVQFDRHGMRAKAGAFEELVPKAPESWLAQYKRVFDMKVRNSATLSLV